MKIYYAHIARTLVVVSAVIVLTNANVSRADDILRVEEDWELVLGTPDRDTVSPQATCTFAPTGNLDSFYAVFDLNLRNFPSYEAGGVQLQLWNGDSSVEAVREKAGYTLRTDGESITWTQRMKLNDHNLQFAIVNGNSTTWGQFGASSAIAITIPSELENLNSYSPELSVENSGIGFGANRVVSLTLIRTRSYDDSHVHQDTTPRVVYPKP